MKATDQPFSSIIEGNKQFKIPVFQRDYRWTTAQCFQLWTDLTRNQPAGGETRGCGGRVPHGKHYGFAECRGVCT